ncbi:unnamed protein product [Prorocentrum cordatum]|uniref:Uncharacterized protein n=1 Tax=Prorocentrum cordatum TaxID=2364126 RepID=A0ABN9UH49_9DINO|nr:unnamed protein product [Polarella glacialis]
MALEGRDLARKERRRLRLPPDLGAHLGAEPTTMVGRHGVERGVEAGALEAARRRLRGKRPLRDGGHVPEAPGDEEAPRPALGDAAPPEDAESVPLVAELHAGGGLALSDELAARGTDVSAGAKVICRRADGRPVLRERVALSEAAAWRAQAFENARGVVPPAAPPMGSRPRWKIGPATFERLCGPQLRRSAARAHPARAAPRNPPRTSGRWPWSGTSRASASRGGGERSARAVRRRWAVASCVEQARLCT